MKEGSDIMLHWDQWTGILGAMVFSIGFPTAMALVLHKKHRMPLMVFFAGAAAFFVSAMLLEQIVHAIVFTTKLGQKIQNSTAFYALYGGIAAGLFEETGRYLVIRLFLRKKTDRLSNAVMFGAGHGGCEVLMVLGTAMINNLLFAALFRPELREILFRFVPEEQHDTILTALQTLQETPGVLYLLGIAERIFAVALHIALSILVWNAVREKKFWKYPLAIGIHAAVDAAAVIVSRIGLPALITEIVIAVLSVSVLAAVCATQLRGKTKIREKLNESTERTEKGIEHST